MVSPKSSQSCFECCYIYAQYHCIYLSFCFSLIRNYAETTVPFWMKDLHLDILGLNFHVFLLHWLWYCPNCLLRFHFIHFWLLRIYLFADSCKLGFLNFDFYQNLQNQLGMAFSFTLVEFLVLVHSVSTVTQV